MRQYLATTAACLLFGSVAIAQTAPSTDAAPARDEPNNAAMKSQHENNAAYPVAGANSFTKAQAKSAIEAKGYTAVSGLKKDANGVWRGTATKNGQSGPVSVDYQGNVN